jgi:hypothetical protein
MKMGVRLPQVTIPWGKLHAKCEQLLYGILLAVVG